jgi:DNA-binding MurR/RpiR family transcriptional regulator
VRGGSRERLRAAGRTREVIETLAEADSQGALTVAVTSFERSPRRPRSP